MVSINVVHRAGATVIKSKKGVPLNRFELFLAMIGRKPVSLQEASGRTIKGRITNIGVTDSSEENLDLTIVDPQKPDEGEQVLAITERL